MFFLGLDFSEILSIFIKPSRRANILKEVLFEYPKAIAGDEHGRNRETAPLYERCHNVQDDALPWHHQQKGTAFMQGGDAEKVQTTP